MKSEYLHIKIDEPTKEQLRILAEAENRTMSNLIITLIKEYAKSKQRK
jgi:predicted transcriptional regulator